MVSGYLVRTTVGSGDHLVIRLPGRILDGLKIGSMHGSGLSLSQMDVQLLHHTILAILRCRGLLECYKCPAITQYSSAEMIKLIQS